jgi:hypothetical protein
MSFWTLMLYALCAFAGLVIVVFALQKVFGPKKRQGKTKR